MVNPEIDLELVERLSRDIRVVRVCEELVERNPISGHSWTNVGRFKHYEVRGGGFQPTRHRSYNSAKEEVQTRINILNRMKEMAELPIKTLSTEE